jgi:hypothetical protein
MMALGVVRLDGIHKTLTVAQTTDEDFSATEERHPSASGAGTALRRVLLPMTIELARKNKKVILPHLPAETSAFPYVDRVLIWLHPMWQENVQQFHRSSGMSMSQMFCESPHKFRGSTITMQRS